MERPSRIGESMSTSPRRDDLRYEVLVAGKIHPWDREVISVPEIRELGGFPSASSVVEIDFTTGRERQLAEDEVHELTPLEDGKSVEKKIGFKHG